jgi:integral membrane sensor domain MASE1
VYSLPPELHEIYMAYVAEVARKREASEQRIQKAAAILYYGAAVGLIVIGFIGILK